MLPVQPALDVQADASRLGNALETIETCLTRLNPDPDPDLAAEALAAPVRALVAAAREGEIR